MNYVILLIFLLSFNAFGIKGHDERIYIHGTKWADLLNGIVKINECTGFVLEGDILVTAAHCFKYDYELSSGEKYSSIKEDKIDYENLKKAFVFFGDANFDELDKTKKSHFDQRSEVYRIRDLFLGYNPSKKHRSTQYARYKKDYALVKLEKQIPKKIKRFKIFHSDLLKNYEILKHPDSGNLSTAGYHSDNTKTKNQRMAHIGCKVRDMKQYRKVWFDMSDCDGIGGASGSPIFYILRHKKTGKIELAVRSILIVSNLSIHERKPDFTHKSQTRTNHYRLGFDSHYISSLYRNKRVFTGSNSIMNHKEFLSHLEKFKKKPSFFRNESLADLEKSKYLDQNWLYENIIQKKTLKELKDFINHDLFKIARQNDGFYYAMDTELEKISKDESFLMDEDKRAFLQDSFDLYSDDNYFYRGFLLQKTVYPYKRRAKQFSLEKLDELLLSFKTTDLDLLEKTHPYEDSINDLKKAQKLWKLYFNENL